MGQRNRLVGDVEGEGERQEDEERRERVTAALGPEIDRDGEERVERGGGPAGDAHSRPAQAEEQGDVEGARDDREEPDDDVRRAGTRKRKKKDLRDEVVKGGARVDGEAREKV